MMSGYVRSMLVGLFGLGLVACGDAGESAAPGPAENASIQLELTKVARSGNMYRLGPATFDIVGPTTLSVDASGDDALLHVVVEPGRYEVTLHEDWVLQLLDGEGNATPITATLLSTPVQSVDVEPFQVLPLTYAFHLGETAIDIGIDVAEGVPPGYDGIIEPTGDGRYMITFPGNGGACCYANVSEAQQSYPDLSFFIIEG